MSSSIYTRHHHAVECIREDEVYFTAPVAGRAIHYSQYSGGSLDQMWRYFQLMSGQPRFVIDEETLKLAHAPDYHRSLLDMKKAGVFHLPYEAIIVEVRRPRSSSIISLWEPRPTTVIQKQEIDAFGYVCRVHEDEGGRYLVVAPSTSGITIADRDDEPWVQFGAVHQNILPVRNDDLIAATYSKDCSEVALALFSVMLLMATDGIGREVVECEKLNKKRAASGKPPIPGHTYLHIKKVYRSSHGDEADDYDPRRSPRPHWRRGHLRHVRHGAGREKIKLVYIKPKLVAYHGDAVIEPRPPDYKVTV